MKYAVCVLSLGYTRLAGITLYDSATRDFTETTPRVARELLSKGLVKGVKWENDGFVPDKDFNMQDILVKTAVGKYRPLLNDIPGEPVNSTYMVVRVLETNKGRLYEIVSNKCQRVKITEEQLRGLNEIGNVSGVFVTDEEIKVCDGVVIEDRVYPDNVNLHAQNLLISEEERIKAELAEASNSEEESAAEPTENQAQQENQEQTEQTSEPTSMEEVFSGLDAAPTEEATEEQTEQPEQTTPVKKTGAKKKGKA